MTVCWIQHLAQGEVCEGTYCYLESFRGDLLICELSPFSFLFEFVSKRASTMALFVIWMDGWVNE